MDTRGGPLQSPQVCTNLPKRVTRRRLLQNKSFLLLCHLHERGDLPEEVLFRLSRASEHFGARIQIRHDSCLCPDLRAATNPKMPSHSRLAADADEVLKYGRTRNADLGDDD